MKCLKTFKCLYINLVFIKNFKFKLTMDLPHTFKTQRLRSRRGCHLRKMHFNILLLMGLWISNTIIGCAASK